MTCTGGNFHRHVWAAGRLSVTTRQPFLIILCRYPEKGRRDRRDSRDFVCVEVLRPSQPNGVMSSAVSLPNHTFTGQAYSSKRLTSIVHILSPETDNCPS